MPQYTNYDDDSFDEEGLLKDGRRMRTSMFAMDSMQRSVAMHVTDAFGDSGDAAMNRPGARFSDVAHDGESGFKREELYAFADAEQAAQWRGGLQVGDTVELEGKRFTVDQRHADGRTKLALDRRSTEEVKGCAYEAYDAEIQEAWRGAGADDAVVKEGDQCTTADGRRGRVVRKNLALACEPVGSADSLPDLLEQRRAVTSDAYAQYDDEIGNAWRS